MDKMTLVGSVCLAPFGSPFRGVCGWLLLCVYGYRVFSTVEKTLIAKSFLEGDLFNGKCYDAQRTISTRTMEHGTKGFWLHGQKNDTRWDRIV